MAELFLRLGCGLVGWLLVFAHGLLLAVVPAADCTTELWSASALFAGLAAISALWLLPAGLQWRQQLRWCSLPAAALWLRGGQVCLELIVPGTLGGVALCEALAGASEPAAPLWQRAWPPLQLLVIAGCALQTLRFWRSPAD